MYAAALRRTDLQSKESYRLETEKADKAQECRVIIIIIIIIITIIIIYNSYRIISVKNDFAVVRREGGGGREGRFELTALHLQSKSSRT
jgi:hypothetical protein